MATAQSLLTSVESRIQAMLSAPFDGETGEYEYDGRRWKRIEFASELKSLREFRKELRAEASRASRSAVRLGGLRRAN